MASEGDKKRITLTSSDSKEFEVEEAVAMMSQTIREFMIEDGYCTDNRISLPNIDSKILSKVIEYCKKHFYAAAKPADSAARDVEDLKNWDAEFVNVDLATLLDLLVAVDYLNIEGLDDLTRQTVMDMIEGKSMLEIRYMLNTQDEKFETHMAVARLLLD